MERKVPCYKNIQLLKLFSSLRRLFSELWVSTQLKPLVSVSLFPLCEVKTILPYFRELLCGSVKVYKKLYYCEVLLQQDVLSDPPKIALMCRKAHVPSQGFGGKEWIASEKHACGSGHLGPEVGNLCWLWARMIHPGSGAGAGH